MELEGFMLTEANQRKTNAVYFHLYMKYKTKTKTKTSEYNRTETDSQIQASLPRRRGTGRLAKQGKGNNMYRRGIK